VGEIFFVLICYIVTQIIIIHKLILFYIIYIIYYIIYIIGSIKSLKLAPKFIFQQGKRPLKYLLEHRMNATYH
jgi:hypothetical protein